MVNVRVVPCLLLKGRGLVKTIRFKDPTYLGDPRNTVKIFNEKEVDELILLDILATLEKRGPDFELVEEIVSEAFMPVAYGGGIRSLEQAKRMVSLGVEKIVVCSHAAENPTFVREASTVLGSQSVVVCIDVKRSLLGKYEVMIRGGRAGTNLDPVGFAVESARQGAGEILINSIDRDGTMQGYDLPLIKQVATAVNVPVIACGGAGTIDHLQEAVRVGGASAVAAGSMFVFQGRHRAVLINYPPRDRLERVFADG